MSAPTLVEAERPQWLEPLYAAIDAFDEERARAELRTVLDELCRMHDTDPQLTADDRDAATTPYDDAWMHVYDALHHACNHTLTPGRCREAKQINQLLTADIRNDARFSDRRSWQGGTPGSDGRTPQDWAQCTYPEGDAIVAMSLFALQAAHNISFNWWPEDTLSFVDGSSKGTLARLHRTRRVVAFVLWVTRNSELYQDDDPELYQDDLNSQLYSNLRVSLDDLEAYQVAHDVRRLPKKILRALIAKVPPMGYKRSEDSSGFNELVWAANISDDMRAICARMYAAYQGSRVRRLATEFEADRKPYTDIAVVNEGDRCIADCRRDTYVRLWQRTVTRWCIVNYWIKRTGESQGGANAPIGVRASAEFESDAGLTDVLAVANA